MGALTAAAGEPICVSKADMKYTVKLQESNDGFLAECDELGLSSSGLSATNALDALRNNIRFNLEFCPCSSMEEGDIELDVVG